MAEAERQLSLPVKRIRSDNGGEYIPNALRSELQNHGIVQEFTAPYAPAQNGVSERANRTVLIKVKSMLFESGLPKQFWGEAAATAVYLKNDRQRAPCPSHGPPVTNQA
jgi:transposase InsO family protein